MEYPKEIEPKLTNLIAWLETRKGLNWHDTVDLAIDRLSKERGNHGRLNEVR